MCVRQINIVVAGISVSVTGLFHDSRQVQPGGLYFALKDGRYVNEAVQKGAVVVVTEDSTVQVPDNVVLIITENVRSIMALAAKDFYGNIVDKMRVTAVVGTNGKTTTTYIMSHILEKATGKKVGLIGTTGIFNAGECWKDVVTLTTPDPIDLHKAFSDMYANGVRDVVMEVSAHAIHYHKIDGINFAGVIFTNITQDHLDFFETFEQYKDTKISFFRHLQTGNVIVNADDKYGKDVADVLSAQPNVFTVGYSLNHNCIESADHWTYVESVQMSVNGSDFVLGKLGECFLSLPGLYNVYNAVAAALLSHRYGVTWNIIKESLATVPSVPGRFNLYQVNGISVIIDYAHTPDGLSQLLQNARAIMPQEKKLFVVFGCGGDRDRIKRPEMGRIAYRLADYVVLTSDNPRTEDPDVIIDEIERGIITMGTHELGLYLDGKISKRYTRITDRTEAIKYAIKQASCGDLVVIAGKGHENYMEINHEKIPYMDSKVLDNILRG